MRTPRLLIASALAASVAFGASAQTSGAARGEPGAGGGVNGAMAPRSPANNLVHPSASILGPTVTQQMSGAPGGAYSTQTLPGGASANSATSLGTNAAGTLSAGSMNAASPSSTGARSGATTPH